ncbi:hypothetical protein Tco_0681233 [Tanacetum coccineum]|uniref:Uncharacterized protein n=1 Tax=Tanacetum coccineum TaxID=301880 RepID=A0ABQ4XMS7_9ASTR
MDVIIMVDLEEEPAPTGETSAPPAPKTAKQLAAKRNQERVKSILLLAIPDEYLLKFHNVADVNITLGKAIKSRFGYVIEESRRCREKMKISTRSSKKLFHLLGIKFPLIMRNKPGIDEIDIDDLYNNLRYASEDLGLRTVEELVKFSSTLFALCSMLFPFDNQHLIAKLENKDFQQINEDDLEELDLRWQGSKFRLLVGTRAVVNTGKGKLDTNLKKSKGVCAGPKEKLLGHVAKDSVHSCSRRSVEFVGTHRGFPNMKISMEALWDFEVIPKDGKYNGVHKILMLQVSRKDKEPTQEYILLPLHPHRTRILVEDVAPAAHEKPSKSSPKDNDVQDSEDVAVKLWDDATRQAFEEEKRNIASQKRAAQATSINKLSTGRSSVSTATTPYVSAASTPTGANAGESSFVYLGGKIPIDASTLPNADLPIDPNMPDLEDDSDAFSNDGIFNRAYDDENVGAVADFNDMDNTINVSPIPTLRIHKDHPKIKFLGDPKSAVQTRGKIQKASSVQQALVNYISKQNRTNHKDHQNYLLACFLSQEEPKNISKALQ